MRKILLGLSISLATLASMASLSFAAPDRLSNERSAVWRASSTCSAFAWGVLSTGSLIIHSITIDSPTVNASISYLAIFNSSAAPFTGNSANFLTTGTFTSANAISNVSGIGLYPPQVYDAYYTTGAVINKVGASCTTVWWDYRNPGKVDNFWYQQNVPWKP